jgi:RHS repeat-associated protein
MFSAFGPWCVQTCIGAHESEGEKPHQGVASKKSALHLGQELCNSTTALGLRGMSLENGVRSRCTGKERDSESGLDNFGARFDSSNLGRFMTPDWSAVPVDVPYAQMANPQSLNLYAYVMNSPVTTADLDGHVGDAVGIGDFVFMDAVGPVSDKDEGPPKTTSPMQGKPTKAPAQDACGFGCKVSNFFSSIFESQAQVTADHRQWLINHATSDADKEKLKRAPADKINNTYACRQISSCSAQLDTWIQAAAMVRFGNNPNQDYHTFRHVEEAGIDKSEAEDAIRGDLADKAESLPKGQYNGRVNVGGKTLDYSAYKLPDGTINVGRITVQ